MLRASGTGFVVCEVKSPRSWWQPTHSLAVSPGCTYSQVRLVTMARCRLSTVAKLTGVFAGTLILNEPSG